MGSTRRQCSPQYRLAQAAGFFEIQCNATGAWRGHSDFHSRTGFEFHDFGRNRRVRFLSIGEGRGFFGKTKKIERPFSRISEFGSFPSDAQELALGNRRTRTREREHLNWRFLRQLPELFEITCHLPSYRIFQIRRPTGPLLDSRTVDCAGIVTPPNVSISEPG